MLTDPLKNLKALGLREDMIVADLGAGTGFYSILAAHLVPYGKVYAVEIQKDFLHTIINKAKEERLKNLECIWGDVEKIGGTKIKDCLVDVVICSNIFSQIYDNDKFIKEIKRILKKDGKILMIDHSENSLLFQNKKEKRLNKEEIKTLFLNEGFIFLKEIDAGDHNYGIIFSKVGS